MTTFTIDVDSIKALAAKTLETVSSSDIQQCFQPMKLKILSSIFVISVGGYFAVRRILSSQERSCSQGSQPSWQCRID